MSQQRKARGSIDNPHKAKVNCLGVTSTQLREMGGKLGMQTTRAVRKMNARTKAAAAAAAADVYDEYNTQYNTYDAPVQQQKQVVVDNPRDRRRQIQTNGGTRTSVFQRRTGPAAVPEKPQPAAAAAAAATTTGRPAPEFIKVMAQLDQQKAKLEMLTHRIDGLSEQVQKKSAGSADGLAEDIEEIVETVQQHSQTLEEVQEIINLVRDMDTQLRELHDSSHFFYAEAAQQVPCLEEPSFEAGQGPGYIAAGERVMLISPQQPDSEGNIWIRARRIDNQARIAEYWVPLITEEQDYFQNFQL